MMRIMSTFGLIIIVLGMSLILTSCWDRHELNEIAIPVAMGMDKTDDGIEVTMQIVNPGEVSSNKPAGGYSPPVSVFSATEATTLEAISKLTTIVPRQIITSHLRIMVIGEKLAREGISEILDGITRHYEVRSDFYIIVARDTTAKNIISILAPVEKIPANRMFTTLEVSEKLWAPTTTVQLNELIIDIASSSKQPVLTGIYILGNKETGKTLKNLERSEPYTKLQYSGIAIFKSDKLVDWLDEEESRGFNYIMNKVNYTTVHIQCPKGGTLGLEVTRSRTKIKGSVTHGRPKIHINVYREDNINEVQCKIDLTKQANIEKLQKIANKELMARIKMAIKKAQKNRTDIFGFGENIEDANPKAWLSLKEDWDEEFADLDVSINVEIKIRRLGTINNAIGQREE